MNIFSEILALLQLAPDIVQTIQTVETIVTAPKAGAAKKAIVMATVVDAKPAVQARVSKFIDTTVGILKHLKPEHKTGSAPVAPGPVDPPVASPPAV